VTTKEYLAQVARAEALKCWHGAVMGLKSNIQPIIEPWAGNKWTLKEADGLWCAAFVYHCCRTAGYDFPIRPRECASCNLAGCGAWEEWAKEDNRIGWRGPACQPQPGDIVLFDRVFANKVHDHIGIVLENRPNSLITAEGNLGNVSGVVERPKDGHIRGYISLPDGFVY
jgi:hypothetical protein